MPVEVPDLPFYNDEFYFKKHRWNGQIISHDIPCYWKHTWHRRKKSKFWTFKNILLHTILFLLNIQHKMITSIT